MIFSLSAEILIKTIAVTKIYIVKDFKSMVHLNTDDHIIDYLCLHTWSVMLAYVIHVSID